jgi:hypothetical protein
MTREIGSIFPGVDTTDMLVVPTCQQAALDLVKTGEKVDVEKDRLLERVCLARAHWTGANCSLQCQSHHPDSSGDMCRSSFVAQV